MLGAVFFIRFCQASTYTELMLDCLADGWIVNAVARCLIVEKMRDGLNRLTVFRISLLMLSQSANSWRERNTYSLEGITRVHFILGEQLPPG